MAKAPACQTLMTPEGERLSGVPWQAYPRPQLRRESFINLNGPWDFEIAADDAPPASYSRAIVVPFPPESALSGVQSTPRPGEYLFYRRHIPLEKPSGRLLLHFGAIDQTASVCVNGCWFSTDADGYSPFSLDVTDCWQPDTEIIIRAHDPLDLSRPYGKQRRKRGGMWYTPTSGVWQTVWMEYVPDGYIRDLRLTPGLDRITIEVDSPTPGKSVCIHAPEGDIRADWTGRSITVPIPFPRLWSPEDPFLYGMTITAGQDRVESYFALRTLETGVVDGVPRLLLNGSPIFFHGLLDQGYFSDGIFLPAAPEGYTRDIQSAKALGFNMLRKHIKREPDFFYYECDRLGMIVFQDFVNAGHYSFLRDTALPTIGMKRLPGLLSLHRKRTQENFTAVAERMVRDLFNHPCICCWTIFNEGWGQFHSDRMYALAKRWDPTRFIDSTSGWFAGRDSDVDSRHVYFRSVRLTPGKRPLVLSEFGGYACHLPDHAFCRDHSYGYRKFDSCEALESAIIALYRDEIIPSAQIGLCAAVLTQLSDVEDETNGMLTYDRKVCKLHTAPMLEIAASLQQAAQRGVRL